MPKAKGETPTILGWCSDSRHEICIMETISGIVCECECKNHGLHKDDWKEYQRKEMETWNLPQDE